LGRGKDAKGKTVLDWKWSFENVGQGKQQKMMHRPHQAKAAGEGNGRNQ